MNTKAVPAKTVARKAAAKRSPQEKMAAAKKSAAGASSGALHRYQVYDTTVEPQHTTRERIARAVALASSR